MKIYYSSTNQVIEDYTAWETLYPKGKDGHSALEFGKFIMKNNGLKQIQKIIESSLSEKVVLEKVYVEKGVKFDNFQRDSQRDMVIYAKTESEETVFVTIEAKASEDFGSTVKSAYASAVKYRYDHTESKRAERIEKLYKNLIKQDHGYDTSDLRYQLFHASAATASSFVEADRRIMIVLEFKECANDKQIKRNLTHFLDFAQTLEYSENLHTNDFISYDASVLDKKIRLIYAEV